MDFVTTVSCTFTGLYTMTGDTCFSSETCSDTYSTLTGEVITGTCVVVTVGTTGCT